MASKFVPNPAFLLESRRDPAMGRMLAIAAGVTAARGQELAASEAELTGDYRDSIRAVVGLEAEGFVGRVLSDDFKAGWIENGTGEPGPTKAHHILTRAAESSGLHVLGPGG